MTVATCYSVDVSVWQWKALSTTILLYGSYFCYFKLLAMFSYISHAFVLSHDAKFLLVLRKMMGEMLTRKKRRGLLVRQRELCQIIDNPKDRDWKR